MFIYTFCCICSASWPRNTLGPCNLYSVCGIYLPFPLLLFQSIFGWFFAWSHCLSISPLSDTINHVVLWRAYDDSFQPTDNELQVFSDCSVLTPVFYAFTRQKHFFLLRFATDFFYVCIFERRFKAKWMVLTTIQTHYNVFRSYLPEESISCIHFSFAVMECFVHFNSERKNCFVCHQLLPVPHKMHHSSLFYSWRESVELCRAAHLINLWILLQGAQQGTILWESTHLANGYDRCSELTFFKEFFPPKTPSQNRTRRLFSLQQQICRKWCAPCNTEPQHTRLYTLFWDVSIPRWGTSFAWMFPFKNVIKFA